MIQRIEAVPSPIPGVTVRLLQAEDVNRNLPQILLVEVEDGFEVPAHKHGVNAVMFGSGKRARLIAPGTEYDGLEVRAGDRIEFPAFGVHGFTDCEEWSFISINGGIVPNKNGVVDGDPGNWDMKMS